MFEVEQNKSFLKEFNGFLDQLESLFDKNDTTKEELNVIRDIKKEVDDSKINRGKFFYSLLEDSNCFELFLNKKVNAFSSKNEKTNEISNSLLGETLPLKKLVNKQSEKTKEIIWNYLHTFYLLNETDDENKERVEKIESNLKKSINSNDISSHSNGRENVANKLLDMDLNESTSDLINDIITSFENKVNDMPNQNPMESIMDITNSIASKYTEKIESGEIQLEDLLENMKSKLPGLDQIASNFGGLAPKKEEKEVTIIDENFSTDQVELGLENDESKGMNLTNGLKMLSKMQSDPQLGKMFEMLNPNDSSEPTEFLEKLKEGLPKDMPEDLLKNMEKEMANMPEMLSKMMNMDFKPPEPPVNEGKEVNDVSDETCENAVDLNELKEKFGLNIDDNPSESIKSENDESLLD